MAAKTTWKSKDVSFDVGNAVHFSRVVADHTVNEMRLTTMERKKWQYCRTSTAVSHIHVHGL